MDTVHHCPTCSKNWTHYHCGQGTPEMRCPQCQETTYDSEWKYVVDPFVEWATKLQEKE